MPKGVYAVASAMVQEQRLMDGVAENLANSQSAGFRRVHPRRVAFAELLDDVGRQGIAGTGGAGVTRAGVHRSFAPGQQQRTDNPLDLALQGEGAFFRLQAPDGRIVLTRNGHFGLDDRQRIVNQDGWLLQGQGGAITLPADAAAIHIDESGRVSAEIDGASEFVEQLRISHVPQEDLTRLRAESGQFFEAPAELADATDYHLHQGFVEGSNVEPLQELVRMVALQRRYDAAQRAMGRHFSTQGFSDVLRGVS